VFVGIGVVGVAVGTTIDVFVGTGVVGVADGVIGVFVGTGVDAVADGVIGVFVGTGVDAVADGVIGVFVGPGVVGVADGVIGVFVGGPGVFVFVYVYVGVFVGTGVVGVADGVTGVFVFVNVLVGVKVGVFVFVNVLVLVNVYVGVFVAAACTEIVKTSVDLSPQAFVYVAVKVSVPTLNGMLSISRDVEVKSLGPVQLQEPPVVGCGPRFTVEAVEVTEALFVCCHAPPFTCIYGVICVVAHGVAVLVGVKVEAAAGVDVFVAAILALDVARPSCQGIRLYELAPLLGLSPWYKNVRLLRLMESVES
jgi:hypothetical protein